jgi:pyruvate,water dikinase
MTTMAQVGSELILTLRNLGTADFGRAGGKAANLGELLRAGLPVPDGFVVTTAALELFLSAAGLHGGSPPEAVAAAPFPVELTTALREAFSGFAEIPLAVRSSALAEDLPDASFAGQYESILDVRGFDAFVAAVRRCWASAFSERVAAYKQGRAASAAGGIAVLCQRLIPADAAGVAFTANPMTGARGETLVSAVRGLAERLVSGRSSADEWVVADGQAVCRRAPEEAIDAAQALSIAALARRVEAHFGTPQDIEWAIFQGEISILQARPMTALPEEVEWQAPPGGWVRNYRIGEWLGDPVTPLFETWLLPRIETAVDDKHREVLGMPGPHPPYVVVNGWYYGSMNHMPDNAGGMYWILLRYLLPRMLYRPRRTSISFLGLDHLGFDLYVEDWRRILARYRPLVEAGEAKVERLAPAELVELVEELALVAASYFGTLIIVAGFGWRAEVRLAKFFRQHVEPGGTHQHLLCGLFTPTLESCRHAVLSLDWVHETLGETGPVAADDDREERRRRLEDERRAAEAGARQKLAGNPKLLRQFNLLLERAQRSAALREEQVRDFTLGWPLFRRALLRLGGHLRERGVTAAAEDVFFLTREELSAALGPGAAPDLSALSAERRRTWEKQRRLSAPLVLGKLPEVAKGKLGWAEAARSTAPAGHRRIGGQPGSPGRVTGPVRIIRSREEFSRLQPGDVLVAPATTPAWTQLFARAAAVVTDTGTFVAHASLVAREYGIPAVVGAVDATSRLKDGEIVTVDGNAGYVEVRG